MTTEEALQRGNNLAVITVLTLAGFAFAPEAILEDEASHKVDDVLLFLLGLLAITWYRRTGNRSSYSAAPLLMTIAALVVKVAAVIIEAKDAEDVGDDFGALVLFILATVLAIVLYRKGQAQKKALATK